MNILVGWWWAEDIASLLFLFWLVGETREALEEARKGMQTMAMTDIRPSEVNEGPSDNF